MKHDFEEVGLVVLAEFSGCNDERVGHSQNALKHARVLTLQEVATQDDFEERFDVFLELVELFGGSFEYARKGEERRSDEERNLLGLGVSDVLEHHGDDKVGFDVEAE